MILTNILHGAVTDDEPVLKEFVSKMGEAFITQHTLTSAKGGSDYDFGKNPDQSMVSHIFNGIFPTMRLLAQADRVRPQPYLSELGQKLYLLGYAMHDLNKINDELRAERKELDTASQQDVQHALDVLNQELRKVKVADFLPNYEDYLLDILYLVVNTQKVHGTNHSIYSFPNMRLGKQERERIRDLCTYSDCLSFLTKNPADVLHGPAHQTLNTVVKQVSNDRFSLVYHQFSDVRGLLTNLINNAVRELLVSQSANLIPYLFYTNGIIYLKTDPTIEVDISPIAMQRAVRDKLNRAFGLSQDSRIADNLVVNEVETESAGEDEEDGEEEEGEKVDSGVRPRFDRLSNLKFTEDLIDPDKLPGLLVKACLSVGKEVTANTLAKMQESGRISATTLEGVSTSNKFITTIARFLLNFDKLIIRRIAKKDATLGKQLERKLKDYFGFSDADWQTGWISTTEIPQTGGMEYRYFWLGVRFVRTHPLLADVGEDAGSLTDFLHDFVAEASPSFLPAIRADWKTGLLTELAKYVTDHLSFGGVLQPTQEQPNFAAEFKSYEEAKCSSKRSLPCTLCNSSYLIGRRQEEGRVLFQPWVYKNRLPLYQAANNGGICAICLLELALRQSKAKAGGGLVGKKFEAMEIKFIYLYPNYFFTTETAALVQYMTNHLDDFYIGRVKEALNSTELQAADYLNLPIFNIGADYMEANPPRTYYQMEYDTGDVQGLIFFGHKTLSVKKASGDTSKPTASERWAIPAILGLMLPLALGCKVVVSDSSLPLYASGEDFKETVVLDTPHPFLSYLLTSEVADTSHIDAARLAKITPSITPSGRVRLDRLLERLNLLTEAYFINYDTNGKDNDPRWSMVNRIARGIRSDPLNVFHYLEMQARAAKKPPPSLASGYWPLRAARYQQAYDRIWNALGKTIVGSTDPSAIERSNPMKVIEGLVERYTKFYRPTYRSANIVRPITISAKVLLEHPREPVQTEEEYASDLKLMLHGELMRALERLRKGQGSGQAMFFGKEAGEQQTTALTDYINFFYDEFFIRYCRGQAGLLQSRLNNIKSGCEAYYAINRERIHPKREQITTATNN